MKQNLKGEKLFVFLAVFSAGILLTSNLAATKIFDFFGIPVDGGIIVFPLSYIICDIIMELFGKKKADFVLYLGFSLSLFASIIFFIIDKLPVFPGYEGGEAFSMILGFVPRIVAGSLISYILSGLTNNYVFEAIRKKTKEKQFLRRAIGSSVPARFVDSMIFETIAFLGVLPFHDFVMQAGFAFVFGLMIEMIMSPVMVKIVDRLKGEMNGI